MLKKMLELNSITSASAFQLILSIVSNFQISLSIPLKLVVRSHKKKN